MSKPIFVLHKHDATHLHWDLRLQVNKVLFSWAVPKGMPTKIGIKRLAIRTPDHALSWATFEGRIPKGEYGAGKVEIEDSGTYMPVELKNSDMTFSLKGKKFTGIYKISKMRGEDNKWIIEKLED